MSSPPQNQEPKRKQKPDYFSALPDDCLLDVLERVDHADLDAISVLSKKMTGLSTNARKNARRVQAEVLRIEAVSLQQVSREIEQIPNPRNVIPFHCQVVHDDSNKFRRQLSGDFSHTDCQICEDIIRTNPNASGSSIYKIHEMFKMVERATRIFCFDKIYIEIDTPMQLYYQLFELHLRQVTANLIILKVNLEGDFVVKLFLDWILSARPDRIYISAPGIERIANFEFVEKLARIFTSPSLTLREADEMRLLRAIEAPRGRAGLEIIEKFTDFHVPNMIFDTQFIMEFVMRKYRKVRVIEDGNFYWRFLTTQPLTSTSVSSGLEDGMQVRTSREGMLTIYNGDQRIIDIFVDDLPNIVPIENGPKYYDLTVTLFKE